MNGSAQKFEALIQSLRGSPPYEQDGVLLVTGFEVTGEELHCLEHNLRERHPNWQGPLVAMTNIGMGKGTAFVARVPDHSLSELYEMLRQHYDGEGWKRG